MLMWLEILGCSAAPEYLFVQEMGFRFTPATVVNTTGQGLFRLKSCPSNIILPEVMFLRQTTKLLPMTIHITSASGF